MGSEIWQKQRGATIAPHPCHHIFGPMGSPPGQMTQHWGSDLASGLSTLLSSISSAVTLKGYLKNSTFLLPFTTHLKGHTLFTCFSHTYNLQLLLEVVITNMFKVGLKHHCSHDCPGNVQEARLLCDIFYPSRLSAFAWSLFTDI